MNIEGGWVGGDRGGMGDEGVMKWGWGRGGFKAPRHAGFEKQQNKTIIAIRIVIIAADNLNANKKPRERKF
jgi:hypothetical protein